MPARLADLVPGTVLADRYKLEAPLGEGATAHVWRARDIELGRVVAVKLLGDVVDPELRARFGREGSILGRLSHPNLVAVHGTGVDEDRPYLVMDFVDGVAFDEVLSDGPLPWRDAAITVAEVAAGLGEAHRSGVLHRDVKPANMVCGRDGVTRLVDFGIARSPDITTMTRADVVLGTSSYLSPEQAQALPLTPAADVYALGCVLFEAVAGRPPFEGDGALAVALQHINNEPDALSAATDAEVPPALEAVVARCLAKEPGARYPTAADLEADLRRLVDGEEPLLGAVGGAAAAAAVASSIATADDLDPDATTTLSAAEVRDGTMVLPAVGVGAAGELIDPAPLTAGPAAASSATAAASPWRYAALALGALLLVAILATAALGGGGDDTGDDVPAAEVTSTTVTTAPPTTAAPPPPPEAEGDEEAPAGKAKGKREKDDDDDD